MQSLTAGVCKRGHPLTPENIRTWLVDGVYLRKACRKCHAESNRRRRHRALAARETAAEYLGLPHCRECTILVGPGHIEPEVDADGLCRDCANRHDPEHLRGIAGA